MVALRAFKSPDPKIEKVAPRFHSNKLQRANPPEPISTDLTDAVDSLHTTFESSQARPSDECRSAG